MSELSTDQSVVSTGVLELNSSSSRVPISSLDIAYVTLTFIMSTMSIFGCVILLSVHWVYSDLRTAGRHLLLHLTVADLLTALGNLLGVIWYLSIETQSNVMAFCKFHSALTIMSSIASFIWTVVIAWFVFWIIVQMRPATDQRRQGCCSKVLPVVCWGIPILIAATALFEDVLGYDTKLSRASWCWIDPTTEYPLLWMLVTGKAWELGACVATIFLYAAVKILLFKQTNSRKSILGGHNRKIEEANTKLTFVPIVFITFRIWGTIRFLLGNFAHSYANSPDADWIVLMQGTGDSAQGFTNFVIYCFFTEKIRHRLLHRCLCPNVHLSNIVKNKDSCYAFPGKDQPEVLIVRGKSNNKIVPLKAGDKGKCADKIHNLCEEHEESGLKLDQRKPHPTESALPAHTHKQQLANTTDLSHLPTEHTSSTHLTNRSVKYISQEPLELALSSLPNHWQQLQVWETFKPMNPVSATVPSNNKQKWFSQPSTDVGSVVHSSNDHRQQQQQSEIWVSQQSTGPTLSAQLFSSEGQPQQESEYVSISNPILIRNSLK